MAGFDPISLGLSAGDGLGDTPRDAGAKLNAMLAELFARGSGYTDEQARDVVAAMLRAGAGLDLVYDDATDTITPTVADPAALRTALALGALATRSKVNGADWNGLDLAVADGGTGASTAPAARANLGVPDFGTAPGNAPVLDGAGKLLASLLPSIAVGQRLSVASQAAQLALVAEIGDVAVRTDFAPARRYMLVDADPAQMANWQQLISPTDVVSSFAGLLGDVTAAQAAAALAGFFQPAHAGLTSIAGAAQTGRLYYLSAANTWSPVTLGANLSFSAGTLAAAGCGGGGSSSGLITESGGNVGIGTTSPQAKLHVVGRVRTDDRVQLQQQPETPASLADGDLWTTPAGLFARINGLVQKFAMLAASNIWTAVQMFKGGVQTVDSLEFYDAGGTRRGYILSTVANPFIFRDGDGFNVFHFDNDRNVYFNRKVSIGGDVAPSLIDQLHLGAGDFRWRGLFVGAVGVDSTGPLKGSTATFTALPAAAALPNLVVAPDGTVSRSTVAVMPRKTAIATYTGTGTFTAGAAEALVRLDFAADATFTLPANDNVPLEVGTTINVQWIGTGQPTIGAAAGVAIDVPARKIAARWQTVTLVKVGADAWTIIGPVAA